MRTPWNARRLVFEFAFAVCALMSVATADARAQAQLADMPSVGTAMAERVPVGLPPAKRFLHASVKAAPDLKCRLHAKGSPPSTGIPVFTDDDGYARFMAVRASAADAPQSLSCTDAAGKASAYAVDLKSDEVFANRPLDIAKERGVDRPALAGDPMKFTQAELSQKGYGLRPNPTDPAYHSWLESATRPGRMLYRKGTDTHHHTVTSATAPPWIGSVMTGAAPYTSITSTFEVPTAIPGADGTTFTEASLWPGLGGYGTGSGLIQAGVTLVTTPTTAAYLTWREYCCGDGDSNGYGGAFVPAPGDKILAQAWYCDAQGQVSLGGGYGCTFLYNFRSGAVFSCTAPKGTAGSSPCWSVKALPLCSVEPNAPNCMTVGTSAEFILENQSGQLTPPTDQFPKFRPAIVMTGMATNATGISTTNTDPNTVVLADYAHAPPHISVALSTLGDTTFAADTIWMDNWTRKAGAPAAAGELKTMVYGEQQHVFYRATDGSIRHLFWAPDAPANTIWTDNWTQKAGAPAAAGDPATMVYGNQQHVFYRATDGSIQHLFWAPDAPANTIWMDNWTRKSGAPGAAGDPATMVSGNQQHVFYRATDGSIRHLFWAPGAPANTIWTDNWTQKAGAPGAAGDPTTMVYGNQQHVFYRATDASIRHLFWGPEAPANTIWSDNWTQKAGAPADAGDPATMVYGNQQHVFYRATNGSIRHLFWAPDAPANTIWSDDWTLKAGAPPAAGDPATMAYRGQQHVFYRDGDGSILHLFWSEPSK